MPELLLICGPNGSGKSTWTKKQRIKEKMPLLDPDFIAKDENLNPVAAGKATITRAKQFIEAEISFAKESTLSSKFDFTLMNLAQERGYKVKLVYVGLDTPIDNIHRVENRVLKGGHFVPEEDVIRRYERSMKNLEKALAVVDKALIFDNSGRSPMKIAIIENGKVIDLAQNLPSWITTALPSLEEKNSKF